MVAALRAAHGLPQPRASLYSHYLDSGALRLQCILFSPHLVPRPPDWTASARMCGYAVLRPSPAAPPARLTAWLAGLAAPPLLVTLGSMAQFLRRSAFRRDAPAVLRLCIQAGLACGRAVLVQAQGVAPPGTATAAQLLTDLEALGGSNGRVMAFDCALPHDLLLPRCAAIACHGGAGTVQAALRASCPVVVVACLPEWDQLWMARLLVRRRLSPAVFFCQSFRVRSLARALHACIEDEALKERVRSAAAAEAETDGARTAARLVLELDD